MRSLKQSRDEVRIGMNFHQPPLFFFKFHPVCGILMQPFIVLHSIIVQVYRFRNRAGLSLLNAWASEGLLQGGQHWWIFILSIWIDVFLLTTLKRRKTFFYWNNWHENIKFQNPGGTRPLPAHLPTPMTECLNARLVCRYRRLDTLTFGVLGAGDIGLTIASYLKKLGMTVYAVKRTPLTDQQRGIVDRCFTVLELDSFLSSCDYICNILPSTAATKGLLSGSSWSISHSYF